MEANSSPVIAMFYIPKYSTVQYSTVQYSTVPSLFSKKKKKGIMAKETAKKKGKKGKESCSPEKPRGTRWRKGNENI